MCISEIRSIYHQELCRQILCLKGGIPNISDIKNPRSIKIAKGIIARLPHPLASQVPTGQTAGNLFEQLTKDFLKDSFGKIQHLRPGKWIFSISKSISDFEQYQHLAKLAELLKGDPEIAAALGGNYIITPDIVIGRQPVDDSEINKEEKVISGQDSICKLTPLRSSNCEGKLILHASISCKWTLRSDRAQNIRTEALNLIRNRKGNTPHIISVTAEPLPTRLASLAFGTGDLDCVYHFALPELEEAVKEACGEDQLDMLTGMIKGRRLRDISDLPFDLAI